MTTLKALQQSRNRESSDAWSLYEPHRRRVTSLILDALPTASDDTDAIARVCLLGAGNCNDVDLQTLTARCATVRLVDLDATALHDAAARQQLEGHSAIQVQPACDVTGIFEQLDPGEQPATEPDSSVVAREIAVLTEQSDAWAPESLPTDFDVVASVCLLSQLVDGVLRRFPDPQTALPLLQAVRRRHLRLLLEHCRPGGCALLVSEVVSSDSAPDLPGVPDASLPQHLKHLLESQNFFTGLHPGIILQELHNDPSIQPLVGSVRTAAPWKWPFLYRTYAVTAFCIERRRA